MRRRCRNPRATGFCHYGGRGIRVCARWDNFATFLADMGPRPSLAHTLDRIDGDGDYTPDNCRWATKDVQLANRRPGRNQYIFTWRGKTMNMMQWAKHLGIAPGVFTSRVYCGWSVERTITTPLTRKAKVV